MKSKQPPPGAIVDRYWVEAEAGPVLRASLDVLELVADVLELLPDYHAEQRKEMQSRCDALHELATTRLKVTPRKD